MYKLRGVIVHSGRAEQGHYYTYIFREKENDWLKLDDSRSSKEYNNSTLSECYGGAILSSEWGFLSEQSANAYVLLYEKVDKRELPLVPATEQFQGSLMT